MPLKFPQTTTHNFASSQVLLSKRIPKKTRQGTFGQFSLQAAPGVGENGCQLGIPPSIADASYKVDGCAYNVSMIYFCLYRSIYIYCVSLHSMLRRYPWYGILSSAGHSLELRLTGQPLSSWLSSFRVSKLLVLELQTRFSLVRTIPLSHNEKKRTKWGSGVSPTATKPLPETPNTPDHWKKHIQSTCSNTWFPDLPGEPSETWHLGNLRNPRNLLFGVPETRKGYPCWGKDSLKQKEKSLTYQENG